MAYAAKSFTLLPRSVVSVSNNLSIATVLGFAALPLLPHGPLSGLGAGLRPQAAAPIEIVRASPVPMARDAWSEPALQRVARRGRPKREPPSEPSPPAATEAATPVPAASHETPSQPVQTQSPPAAGDRPGEAAQSDPSKPDVWSDTQVIASLRECVRLLAPIAADVEVSEPLKQEKCGAPAPVTVRRIGSGTNRVEISPPAIVNCAMVVGLHTWIEKTLQPAAQEAFGSRITRLRSASGYACRNRVGSHSHVDRLSEHALANAIDIAGFVTADGRTIEVANSWGPTARDQEAQRLSATIAHSAPETPGAKNRPGSIQTAQLQKLNSRASDAKAIPASAAPGPEDVAKTAQAQFLRRLHKGACGVFGTVLGPEANEAHRDHFHFDFAHRRNGTYCQ